MKVKGNWENIVLKNGPFNVLDDYEEFCDIMPRTLKYWPTYYTLDEVKSFFRQYFPNFLFLYILHIQN